MCPLGLTTAERRHPKFRSHGVGGCEWDGAVWPYATTQDLKALANLLTNYTNHGKMTAKVFYDNLHKYAWSQQMYGRPYIGEYQDEKNGEPTTEESNADIAQELTDMIEAQRSYTANSKVFQTGSELMDVLVNLKR